MREHYLDNLKTIMILLLFPVHTFMIWNDYGTRFYIWKGENRLLSTCIVSVNPWIMALLFVIAGMCAKYSLEKRSVKEFMKNRFYKLFIPLIGGILFLMPIQTLYARKFFFDYQGSIIENYQYFFTHITDFSGYDGCFSPGHLWFILFLFMISVTSLFIIKKISCQKAASLFEQMNIWGIILLFIPVWIMYYIGNFGGYSIGKYFTLYLLGYYAFTDEAFIEKIMSRKALILSLFAVFQIILIIAYYQNAYYKDLYVNFTGWLGVLACIICGKLFLNKKNRISEYFRKASFPLYLLHQTILVTVAYYTVTMVNQLFLQVIIIMTVSFLLTVSAYELISRIPIIKKLIGIY